MRRLIYYSIILLSLLMARCSNVTPPIEINKIKSILMDIYVAEAQSAFNDSTKNLEKNKDYEKLAKAYNSILNHHGLTEESFTNAMQWYFENPKYFDSVYRLMILDMDSLQARYSAEDKFDKTSNENTSQNDRLSANERSVEEEMNTLKSHPRVKNDSINNKPQEKKPKIGPEFKKLSEIQNEQ